VGYILIDTCVWLNLASTPALRPLVDEIGRHAKPPPHGIVVPSSVKAEFTRNRAQVVVQWGNSLKGTVATLKNLRPVVSKLEKELADIIDASRKAIA